MSSKDSVLGLCANYCPSKPGQFDWLYDAVAPDFARELVSLGASIIGLDTPSPDRAPFEVHKILLAGQVLIIENLTNLEALVAVDNFDVVALPTKLQCEAAPVRVTACPSMTYLPS